MNKYIWLILVVVVIMGGGVAYKLFSSSTGTNGCPLTGVTRNITVTALKNQWAFAPNVIEVQCGDNVALTAINEDEYDHGIGIDQFGVSQRMPASSTITVDFIAVKPGEFPFICSVPCGEGKVNGVTRGHFDMVGTIKVKDMVKTQ